jgi:predicted nucleic acid-binding protein
LKRFVLDASVCLAWFLDSPVPDLGLRARQNLRDGGRALVPAIWHLEVANGFVIAERRGRLQRPQTDRCLDDVEGLLAWAIDSSPNPISLRDARSTGRIFGLSAYDATYLETARRERLPLATLDQALAKAARSAGVEIFS